MMVSDRQLIYTTIKPYLESVGVLKYVSMPTGSIYRQRAKTYSDPPIDVEGQVTFNPSKEMLSAIGERSDVTGMVTFPAIALQAVFPGDYWVGISLSDRLVIRGIVYRVIGVHQTGDLHTTPELLVVTFQNLEGQKGEPYGG